MPANITGTIRYYLGTNAVPNATVSASGSTARTATTLTTGAYSLANLLPGTITVEPRKVGDFGSPVASHRARRRVGAPGDRRHAHLRRTSAARLRRHRQRHPERARRRQHPAAPGRAPHAVCGGDALRLRLALRSGGDGRVGPPADHAAAQLDQLSHAVPSPTSRSPPASPSRTTSACCSATARATGSRRSPPDWWRWRRPARPTYACASRGVPPTG